MRPRWLAVLVASVLVLVAVVAGLVVMTAAALPLMLVLAAAVLALVGSVGTRLRHGTGRRRDRRAPVPSDVACDDPGTGVRLDGLRGEHGLRWSTRWESDPPVHAVPHTRERVTAALAEWGLTGESVEPTLLVVTELLSNAIDHARGPVRLSVERCAETVYVEVHDATPDPPQLQPPDPMRARGRGVHLVQALSLRWGWTPDPPGKVVWADVLTEWPT